MFLYIARHAWAGESGDPRWPDDSQRPLTPEGRERYDEVVKSLVKRGFAPRRIATSPYVRCRETAELLAERIEPSPSIDELEALEPGSDIEAAIHWTNDLGGADACWVGHNPDVELFAAALVGDGSAQIRFAKGAVAAIEFDEEVFVGGGQLYWLATAKLLGL
jgi:phosphohistidine phosphatase